jgi:pectin methylesterase-like acyl-CoA thioesterase
VAADGKGEYTTVQGAVDAAPNTGTTIHIAPGTYREAVVIDKPDIRLIGGGSSSSDTVIVFDKSAGTSGGTLNSATVAVRAPDFFAEHLTIANDWNRTHLQGSQGSQALAVLVTGDKDIFNDVRLLGNQDTLYAGSQGCVNGDTSCTPARQFFSNCYIEGNVDFIFGDGKAYFRDCEIRSTPHRGGYVTAQSKHYPQEESAFVFDHCRFTADAGAGEVWLGRPWRPYATVVFLHAWMDSHIVPAGWREWHPGETHSLDTAWYGEFDSQGPGATMKDRDPHTHLLNADEAQRFTLSKFFPDWNPEAALKAATSR